MAEIRNYRFTISVPVPTQTKCDPKEPDTMQEVIEAYDLNEALTQLSIKFQDRPFVKIIEVIPFKYIEEQNHVVEQKKEVHVKPLPRVKP